MEDLNAPFPYFGGKRKITKEVWQKFGEVKHYIEPFCGSAAMLLAAPKPASLEVICDANGFIANFWRAVRYQPDETAKWADYPVSHIDLGARHQWLMDARPSLAEKLHDPDWHGDAKVAGWWLWGQCCWIGSGWCDWEKKKKAIPHISDAGRGVQAIGQIPHISDYKDNADEFLTSSGRVGYIWLNKLSKRLERVRIVHGEWDRCLNKHYGGEKTAVFLDPPYISFEKLYGIDEPSAKKAEKWAKENENIKIAICGHVGDYDLPGWAQMPWSRGRLTYGGLKTSDKECVWFSPSCNKI